jgi:hypothetical protein
MEDQMAAIEYGSYYWCVVLSEKEPGSPSESIHLHADEIAIDPTGTLTFKSMGRRPAGTEPGQNEQKNGEKPGAAADSKKEDKGGEHSSMIYFALAPGSWKLVYAAKLQDGSPASVEHWNAANGSDPVTVAPASKVLSL